MPASQRKTETAPKPTFFFKGTIKKLKSATMKDVPVNERTAIVTVDQIIEASPGLADYNGQDITVQLSGRTKASVGLEMIFHTISWMYGESIAVQAISQEPVKSSHTAMLAAASRTAARTAARPRIRAPTAPGKRRVAPARRATRRTRTSPPVPAPPRPRP